MHPAQRSHDDSTALSSPARLDDRTRVLKHGDTTAVFDRFGDIEALGPSKLGLFHQDTRFLSRLTLRLAGERLLLLSSTIKDDNALLAVDLMNPDIRRGDDVVIPRGTVHLFRSRVLWAGACYERLRIHNFGQETVEFTLTLGFDADFADIFEVRGIRREDRRMGQVARQAVTLTYHGLDGAIRRARIAFDPVPARLEESAAEYTLRLEPRGEFVFQWTLACSVDGSSDAAVPQTTPRTAPRAGDGTPEVLWHEGAVRAATDALARARAEEPEVVTSNEQFNDWLNCSLADLRMLRTDTPHGPYPYAGVPWFSAAFGRDGIITGLECLWFNPAVARGVLQYLAATQAEAEDAERDAQPGKILHEARFGEMAALGEVPFGRYYGTADATPLFVMLAGAYYVRTGDLDFARTLWPHVDRALGWIDRYGDADGDGFVEYARRSRRGLVNRGWKDAQDSVFHDDGTLAEPPIALCEVQGYVYAARLAAGTVAEVLGMARRAQELRVRLAARQRAHRRGVCPVPIAEGGGDGPGESL